MDDRRWERHANPWSGWSRVPVLPLATAAIFWRDDLGGIVYAVLGLLLLWTWVNPHLFPAPATTGHWMSRAVMGERIWLRRAEIPVPLHYERAIPITLAFAVGGLPLIGIGLWLQKPWPIVVGMSLTMIGKFWFLDRMVWLCDDMSARHPIYRAWLR
jgi:hypothetical protein